MSDLINIGLSATRAYAASLRMVGQNIAGADDPAYVRRRVLLNEATMATRGSPLYKSQLSTGGVQIGGIGRSADPLIDAALRRADGARAETGQRADWLMRLEGAMGDGEFGVGARMTAFFAAGTRAGAAPEDAGRRLEMLNELQRVGEGFAGTAARIDAVDADLTETMTGTVETLNNRMATLVGINRDLRAARPGSASQAQLFDRRDEAVRDIAAILPVTVTTDRHGGATLSVDGAALVDGINAAPVTAIRTPAGGVSLTTNSGTALNIGGGALAGLDRAGQTIRVQRADLDGQAAIFASDINGWNAGGTTGGGAAGGALLTGTTATTLALATADPLAIAAATPGGNPAGNLLALVALRGATGGEERWNLAVNRGALDLRNARADADAAGLIADSAAAQRDAVSGVDLDQEAAELLRLQQAYGAAARVLQIARETVETILNII